MNKIQFKSRKEASEFLASKNIDTSKWTEEKWQSLNKSQAEIHMQALAEAMWDAMNESTPKELKAGEYHIPFGDRIDEEKIKDLKEYFSGNRDPLKSDDFNYRIKISTARCARLSYMNFDGEIDYDKDIKLHDQLLKDRHMSPFEHCARAMTNLEYYSFIKGKVPTQRDEYGILNCEYYPYSDGVTNRDGVYWMGFNGVNPNNGDRFGWCNNFKGFIQYRYLIENNYEQ